MKMIVDVTDVKQYEADLKTFARRAFPFATKATVNSAAFAGQKIARDFIKGRFIERNTFTRRSVQVEQARTLNVRRQYATLGSTADYMERQEFGGVIRATGKEGHPIATPAASGEGALPRRKQVPKGRRLGAIRLSGRRVAAKTRKQRNRAVVMQAAARGGRSRYVFLDLGRRAGIYQVLGGKRRPRIKKIWDMSRRTVVTRPRPWLLPATQLAAGRLPQYYADALVFQLRRAGILGY